MKNPKYFAYFQLILAISIVGSSIVAGKLVIENLPIMLSSALRFTIACPILVLLLFLKEKSLKPPRGRTLFTLFFQSLTGVFLFSICLLFGLQHTNAITAGLIMGTLPAITALLAFVILGEKLNLRLLIGIAFTVAGAMILNIFGEETGTGSSASLLGGILVFIAIICEGLFVVLGKQVIHQVSPLAIATYTNLFALILFLPFGLWEAYHFNFQQATTQDWFLVVYFGLVVSVVSFWLFYSALAKVSATVAGGFMAFLPLSAVLLAGYILNEPILMLHLFAGICVIMGIIIIGIQPKLFKRSKKTIY